MSENDENFRIDRNGKIVCSRMIIQEASVQRRRDFQTAETILLRYSEASSLRYLPGVVPVISRKAS